jgi:hypothetical protein
MAFADNQAISDIYIIVFSAIHFALLCHHDRISFGAALRESPGAAVSFLLGIMVLPAALFLLWYHVIVSASLLSRLIGPACHVQPDHSGTSKYPFPSSRVRTLTLLSPRSERLLQRICSKRARGQITHSPKSPSCRT